MFDLFTKILGKEIAASFIGMIISAILLCMFLPPIFVFYTMLLLLLGYLYGAWNACITVLSALGEDDND